MLTTGPVSWSGADFPPPGPRPSGAREKQRDSVPLTKLPVTTSATGPYFSLHLFVADMDKTLVGAYKNLRHEKQIFLHRKKGI
jgi:hypothetical protein